eukprot:12880-Heterococcus_DN1.PRE.4
MYVPWSCPYQRCCTGISACALTYGVAASHKVQRCSNCCILQSGQRLVHVDATSSQLVLYQDLGTAVITCHVSLQLLYHAEAGCLLPSAATGVVQFNMWRLPEQQCTYHYSVVQQAPAPSQHHIERILQHYQSQRYQHAAQRCNSKNALVSTSSSALLHDRCKANADCYVPTSRPPANAHSL